ncbi:GNAT family N-acetyltransferase [Arsenicicoccus cauae]|uniref:GNAT family N-acetyltransferase n=1 Tax=Arsenicicoccus cauae TaxID=2663847 RepID=UPI00370D7BE6
MPLPQVRPGRRYAVRVATGHPVTGHPVTGSGARDVVGVLVAADTSTWTLLPEDRAPETVAVADVRAAREVPPRVVRPSSSVDDVQRLAARGWPGLEQHRLGGWLLRAGAGYTGRANSALVAGDPGLPVEDAVARVEAFYAERGTRARFQVAYPMTGPDDPAGAVDALLAARGYEVVTPTFTYVADLRSLEPAPLDGLTASWSEQPDEEWLAPESPLHGRHPRAVDVITACPARYLTLRSHGDFVARARLVVTEDWCGITELVVDEGARGRGTGRRAMGELTRAGRAAGARFGYLQVLQTNAAATGLYDALGWRRHHRYHYRVQPS